MLDYIEMHWNAQPWRLNIFHMNIFSAQGFDALSNVKYLSPDGRYEVIICNPGTDAAYIVTSSVNKGTLNYSTFLASLQFVVTITRFVKAIKLNDIFSVKWEDVFLCTEFPELKEYLVKKNLIKEEN